MINPEAHNPTTSPLVSSLQTRFTSNPLTVTDMNTKITTTSRKMRFKRQRRDFVIAVILATKWQGLITEEPIQASGISRANGLEPGGVHLAGLIDWEGRHDREARIEKHPMLDLSLIHI